MGPRPSCPSMFRRFLTVKQNSEKLERRVALLAAPVPVDHLDRPAVMKDNFESWLKECNRRKRSFYMYTDNRISYITFCAARRNCFRAFVQCSGMRKVPDDLLAKARKERAEHRNAVPVAAPAAPAQNDGQLGGQARLSRDVGCRHLDVKTANQKS